MSIKTHKLELYTPAGEYAGLLDVYNLNVDLNLKDFSSISFNIAAYVDEEDNKRLLDVLDLYEVVLSIYERKYRFVLRSIPASFDESGPRYTYEGLSTDSSLDRKIINGWIGAKRNVEFYQAKYKEKTISWNQTSLMDPLVVDISDGSFGSKDEDEIADLIEVFEIREANDLFIKSPLAYVPYDGLDQSLYKSRGSYYIEKNEHGIFVRISGYKPEDVFKDYNKEDTTHIPIMSDDLGIYYQVFYKTPKGFEELLLIGDAAEKIIYKDDLDGYNNGLNLGEYYTTTGVTLEEVLKDNLDNKTEWTSHVDDELKDLRRSDFEFNNISIYQALQEIAESFDVVFQVNTNDREINFYKSHEDGDNSKVNNIVLNEGSYLKSIEKSLDTNELATSIYGLGKDHISVAMFSPTGPTWEDYSYYLDEYWKDIDSRIASYSTLLKSVFNGEVLESFPNLKSRWMRKETASLISIWQKARDLMVDLLLGNPHYEIDPNDIQFGKYVGLIQKRDRALKILDKYETKYISFESEARKYESLVNFTEKDRDSNELSQEDYERYLEISQNKREKATEYKERIKDIERDLEEINELFLEIREMFDSFIERNDPNGEVRKEIQKFKFDYLLQDDTVVEYEDLLEKVKEYAAENAKPKVSLTVDIIDILAAHDIPEEDKKNLFIGNFIYIDFPMFNIKEKAIIDSISIDFDNNDISIEITNVERHSKGLLHKIVDNIRDLKVDTKNNEVYKRGSSNKTNKEFEELKHDFIEGDIVTGSFASSPIQVSQEGIVSFHSKIDHDLCELVRVEKEEEEGKVFISGGAILLEKEVEGGVQRISISAEDGFKITKKDTEGLKKMFSTDEKGNIIMSGSIKSEKGSFFGDFYAGDIGIFYQEDFSGDIEDFDIYKNGFFLQAKAKKDETYVDSYNLYSNLYKSYSLGEVGIWGLKEFYVSRTRVLTEGLNHRHFSNVGEVFPSIKRSPQLEISRGGISVANDRLIEEGVVIDPVSLSFQLFEREKGEDGTWEREGDILSSFSLDFRVDKNNNNKSILDFVGGSRYRYIDGYVENNTLIKYDITHLVPENRELFLGGYEFHRISNKEYLIGTKIKQIGENYDDHAFGLEIEFFDESFVSSEKITIDAKNKKIRIYEVDFIFDNNGVFFKKEDNTVHINLEEESIVFFKDIEGPPAPGDLPVTLKKSGTDLLLNGKKILTED